MNRVLSVALPDGKSILHPADPVPSAGVRDLTAQDVTACSDLLARSFQNNPAMQAILRRPEAERCERLGIFMQAVLPLYLRFGRSYGALVDGQVQAALLTLPPGHYPLPAWTDLRLAWTVLFRGGMPTFRRFLQVDSCIRQHHPPAPHHYVFMLGTDPDFRRRGLASDLLRHLFAQTGGTECYLETDDPSNLPFYAHHGFEVIGSECLHLGSEQLPLWFLSRKSQTGLVQTS